MSTDERIEFAVKLFRMTFDRLTVGEQCAVMAGLSERLSAIRAEAEERAERMAGVSPTFDRCDYPSCE